MISAGLPSLGLASPAAPLGFPSAPLASAGFGPPFSVRRVLAGRLWRRAWRAPGPLSARSQIIRQRCGRLLARRVMLAQEAFHPKKPAPGLGEALRRLVTDGAIGCESLGRTLVPAQGFLRCGAANQPRRRDADRQPGDALAQPFSLHPMSCLLTAHASPRSTALIAYYFAIVTSVGMIAGLRRQDC